MQARSVADQSTRRALKDCQSRVQTMGQIHEMLYQADDYALIPFSKYTRDLVNRVVSAWANSATAVTIDFRLDEVFLPVDRAIPCGLILNELVSNSLKHAFPTEAGGKIRVELHQLPDRRLMMAVSDDGIGISPDVEPRTATSLGLHLVRTLVEQLEAHLEIVGQPGSTFRVVLSTEQNK
jgi:two-component sensor histidine kinase